MTPVDQEFLKDDSIGQYGDCQRAVIASLLDLPIADVPHFLQEAKGDAYDFWKGIRDFCRSHGFLYVRMKGDCFEVLFSDKVYHQITGPSPRGGGIYHAVVGCNGRVVHDPHPSKDGLAGDPSTWTYAFLVKA